MQEIHVKVSSFEDIRVLSDLAAKTGFPISVSDGHRTVDARSLMCIFSLELDRPLALRFHCDPDQEAVFRQHLAAFLVP